jgi:hypothetical protein
MSFIPMRLGPKLAMEKHLMKFQQACQVFASREDLN